MRDLQNDLKKAMLSKDEVTVRTLRSLLTTYKNEVVSKKLGQDGILSEDDFVTIVKRQIKQRQDSIDQYNKADRFDLSAKETLEVAVLQKYLPKMLSEEELTLAIRTGKNDLQASGPAGIGILMKRLKLLHGNSFDGQLANKLIKQELELGL